MVRNWLTGEITGRDLHDLAERAVNPFAERAADLDDYYGNTSRRELKYWFDLLLDPAGTGDARMGLQVLLDPPVTQRSFLSDVDLNLRCQLELIDRRIDAGLHDAWLASLMPYLGGRNLEDACGCGIELNEGSAFPCATPVIHSLDEIDKVKVDLAGSERCRRHLRAIRFFSEQTGSLFPVRVGDVMGPFSLAVEVVVPAELLVGLYTHQEHAHRLMGLLTDAVISWVDMQGAETDNPWRGCWQWRMGPGQGLPLADDSQVLLSPDLFGEFCAPYLEKIGEKFGGFHVHICGGESPTLEPLSRVPGFKGFDTQMSIEQYRRARDIVGPDVLIFAKVREGPVGSIGASTDYVRRFLRVARDTRTMVWINARSVEEARKLEAIAREFAG